ncbi:choline-phosphate cytidylyltransferase-like protein [Lipomyces japonicus]|uniref:choline-phosphate cytidylyltransferase-like protein n=1 Tax=Lipomyces japonicus TaxID=56871 RepID=UPI0034CDA3E6
MSTNKRKADGAEIDLVPEPIMPGKQNVQVTRASQIENNDSIKATTNEEMRDSKEYLKYKPTGFSINPPPTNREVRIYADGVFDLFHLGHMRQLEQAKKAFPNSYLICGIPSDEETHKRKGLTVLTDKQRAETLRHCRWVDEIIENAPWEVTQEFLEEHRIDYVAHDDIPYAGTDGSGDIYQPIKEAGKFLTTQRTEGISTSYIITKIIRDYDKYLIRNFSRGVTRQELNVSWLKKNELDFKRHIADFRDSLKQNISSTTEELKQYLNPVHRDGEDDGSSITSTPSTIARNLGLLRKRRKLSRRRSSSPGAASTFKSPLVSPTLSENTEISVPGNSDDEDEDDNKLLLGLPMFLNGVKNWMAHRKSNGQDVDRDHGSLQVSEDEASTAPSPTTSPSVLVRGSELLQK